MTDRPGNDAETRTQDATEDAREAKHALDEADPSLEEALGADVAEDAGVDAVAHPGAGSSRGDELTGPGSPAP
ncbi:hypothetical protein [Georgenia wangjunii]|uniref:hypothetical protein n=1 Tax=Georgenia wangjunii TaxID=3117730 RepID=UPI002F261766